MDIQLVDNATVTEPISLTEAKAYLQIDADYASDDNQIMIALTTARKRLESYLNIGLVRREVIVYWNGKPIELPLSPTGDILEVKKNDEILLPANYTLIKMPANRIAINEAYSYAGQWFYSIDGYVEYTPTSQSMCTDVYVCRYETGYEELKNDLKQAILAEASHLYNLRGLPITDVVSPNAAILASSYSRNLTI